MGSRGTIRDQNVRRQGLFNSPRHCKKKGEEMTNVLFVDVIKKEEKKYQKVIHNSVACIN